MEGGAREKGSSPPLKKPSSKFSVYQNPAFSAALNATSLQPSNSTLFRIFSLSSASAFALLAILSRENGFVSNLKLKNFSQQTAYLFVKLIETIVGFVFIGTTFALFKTISWRWATTGVPATSSSKETKDQVQLTNRQLGLLGIKPKVEQTLSGSSKKPPKSKPTCSPPDVLVPLHQPLTSFKLPSRSSADKLNSSGGGNKMRPIGSPSKSPSSSSSLYLVPGSISPLSSVQNSPGLDSAVSSPWSNKRVSTKEITSEEKLEEFLAEVDERITESAAKLATPPPTISGFGVASPNTISTSANTSGTTRSTPLRPVRMSPGSQKFNTPPKKGEGELPPPMSMEESITAFEHLGIYPQIEQWHDRLRQWFSSVLLNPLRSKIKTSHIQVMQAAAKLGISITVSQVGSDLQTSGSATVSSADRSKEWQPTVTLDEDGLLHQLRVTLLQAIDASTSKLPQAGLQQSPQQNPLVPVMQECVDAISEHQKLQALMKGEWVKGLLPQSSVRADYTVQRIRELAEGTCLKNYEYLGTGEVYDKKNKKWTLELPTDSHLLLYLFCAFLEHPKWMLHLDPTSYAGVQSSKNPLLLGVLPPKERFPEKYIAVLSGVPSVLHPGACILAVGKQSPPIFALYWDKKLQFSLQGRTALWDSILLLCHRIKVGYGGIIRGLHLGSSALSVLRVLDSETED
ncbi:Cytochrome B561-related [Parasponia andersonii]|uniref:Cytochrome B561-related n=1 Tax=Parasponia andersonii TaxID=3476 RepID=A0A2P5AFK2_PARAD|nr:Cytochrome B561-related [Parasponia andersonii]